MRSIQDLTSHWLAKIIRRMRRVAAPVLLWMTPYARLSPIKRFLRDGYADLITKGLPLNTESVVLDFGGYEGEWASAILHSYGCRIHTFEPIDEYANRLESRFAGDSRVKVHRYAVGFDDGSRVFHLSNEGTGEFSQGTPVVAHFRSARTLGLLLPTGIDLAGINIEGGEYELIPALAEAGILGRINLVFIQFHRTWTEEQNLTQRHLCRQLLSRTHELLWDYDFVWEAWRRRIAVSETGSA